MSNLALFSTLLFILITIMISYWQKLGLERDLAINTVRSAVQLFLIGYVLQYVFRSNQPGLIILIIMMMIGVASLNVSQRAKGFRGIWWKVAITIAFTETLTLVLMLGFRIIEPTPRYIIPMGGMVAGNSMIACSLFLSQMNREVETSSGEIETLLALGATTRQSIQDVLARAVKASMIPNIDNMKTVGLVMLPGVMTGMIVAGASPIEAVRYQILIMFLFAASPAVTSMLLSLITYRMWFTKDSMLSEKSRRYSS
ncbi:ABC transporter permease [Scopulibacillus cellulosilyticus]|uniref:ABC transporter permease n=1 Tax=Scopulibacillus cellulosilyticus TaxID=2665665 RepID=A0ABW2Q0S3_9BACL